ncbi:NAD(P)/FAD-dependent oxidoreductase [Actinoallomurus rhizosphaericola]|uniref:NAD(P)/FAD-dependent oxidoreductase n=1 Tax=Actinoallomurus rhizosphaericola TaxID=2952536 RepID=UPI002092547A|nr:FAD-dependent oxidoreductase [Actinoallomurus rhizosphaericola]MCO5996882.1 FAD-binding oxidoreductase [Actinoallomurus rhizosphaericola]
MLRYAVIGGGIVGAALADRLAGEGASVTLLEQDRPGRATSRWSLAWLNAAAKTPEAYHRLNADGMRAWARLAAELDGHAWYRPVGNLEVADAGRRDRLEATVTRARAWGYAARLVDRDEAAGIEPALRLPDAPARDLSFAWFPEEGYLLTEPLVERLVARARRRGARVHTGDAGRVTGLQRAGEAAWGGGTERAGEAGQVTGAKGPGDRIIGVRTAAGDLVPADVVVCCAGRWTAGVAAMAGIRVPIVDPEPPGSTAPGFVVRVGPVEVPPTRVLHTPGVHLRPHGPHTVHLEAGDVTADLHTPEPVLRDLADTLLERARRVVPSLREARVQEYRVCVRPMPADGMPVAGAVGAVPGLYVVVTHSGVTLAAHLAELVTRELLEDVRLPELAPYRLERFTEDSGRAAS